MLNCPKYNSVVPSLMQSILKLQTNPSTFQGLVRIVKKFRNFMSDLKYKMETEEASAQF